MRCLPKTISFSQLPPAKEGWKDIIFSGHLKQSSCLLISFGQIAKLRPLCPILSNWYQSVFQRIPLLDFFDNFTFISITVCYYGFLSLCFFISIPIPVFVEMGNSGSTDTATLAFTFSGTSTIRTWEIKATQIPCGSDYR